MKQLVLIALVIGLIGLVSPQAKGEEAMIAKGKEVSFDYVLTVDGKQVDSSEANGPLSYTQGDHQIIPGLEKELEGMSVGEQKSVDIPSAEAYGDVNPKAFREIPKEQLPQDIELSAGQIVTLTASNGTKIPAIIAEVKDTSVVINLNHPLAGKDLHFDVTVRDIK